MADPLCPNLYTIWGLVLLLRNIIRAAAWGLTVSSSSALLGSTHLCSPSWPHTKDHITSGLPYSHQQTCLSAEAGVPRLEKTGGAAEPKSSQVKLEPSVRFFQHLRAGGPPQATWVQATWSPRQASVLCWVVPLPSLGVLGMRSLNDRCCASGQEYQPPDWPLSQLKQQWPRTGGPHRLLAGLVSSSPWDPAMAYPGIKP